MEPKLLVRSVWVSVMSNTSPSLSSTWTAIDSPAVGLSCKSLPKKLAPKALTLAPNPAAVMIPKRSLVLKKPSADVLA